MSFQRGRENQASIREADAQAAAANAPLSAAILESRCSPTVTLRHVISAVQFYGTFILGNGSAR